MPARDTPPGEVDLDSLTGRGPFPVRRRLVRRSRSGHLGSAVISWPASAAGPLGAVAVVPGYTGHRLTVGWYGPRLASFGFAVMTLNALGLQDQPEARGTQLLAALDYLCHGSHVAHLVDPTRRAVIGHSMGGAGALIAAVHDPTISAAVALTPWSRTRRWPQLTTPTLIISAAEDRVAPPSVHARVISAGLPAATPQRYIELPGASHYAPLFRPRAAIQGPVVDWLTRYVGGAGDERRRPTTDEPPHR